MRNLQIPSGTQAPGIEATVLDLSRPGPKRSTPAGDWYTNVNSEDHVLQGPARVGIVAVRGLPQQIGALERHPHTAEILTPLGGRQPDCCCVGAALPRRSPGEHGVHCDRPGRGRSTGIPPVVWHSAACGVENPARYLWLNQAEDEPEGWVALNEPIQLLLDAHDG